MQHVNLKNSQTPTINRMSFNLFYPTIRCEHHPFLMNVALPEFKVRNWVKVSNSSIRCEIFLQLLHLSVASSHLLRIVGNEIESGHRNLSQLRFCLQLIHSNAWFNWVPKNKTNSDLVVRYNVDITFYNGCPEETPSNCKVRNSRINVYLCSLLRNIMIILSFV